MYQALYRKWRPSIFDDVVGQPSITATLKNEVASGRVAHAYIFTGSRGTGKTTCAKILAKAVNCLNPRGGDPCNECEICRGIDAGSMLDVVEIDAASNNGVDSIRDLREETVYTPAAAKYRVYIIDEAHMLSTGAFNALLKTLEEPPAYVIFILATTEVHKIPATIMSRCQRFDFRRIPQADLVSRLSFIAQQEKIEIDADALEMIARTADGGARDAISLLDQCAGSGGRVDVARVAAAAGLTGREYLYKLSDAVKNHDTSAALKIIDDLYSSSKDVERLCDELIAHFRDLMVVKTVKNPFDIVTCRPDEKDRLVETAAGFSAEALLHALDTLETALETLKRSASARVGMETCLMRLCRPELDTSNAALLRRIEALEEKLGSGNVPVYRAQESMPREKPAERPSVTGDARPAAPENTGDKLSSKEELPSREGLPPRDELPPREGMPSKEGLPSSDAASDRPLDCWAEVLEALKKTDAPLFGVLRESSAIIRGGFVLIDPNNAMFGSLMKSQEHKRPLVDAVRRVTGEPYKVGIFKRSLKPAQEEADEMDELFRNASRAGIDVKES